MKNVLITGAGRGIGLGLAREFLQNGYGVLATYRNENASQDLLQLKKEYSHLVLVTADVTDEKTFTSLKQEITKLGPIDILINNSGVIGDRVRALEDLSIENMKHVFDVNTLGPIRICKLVIPFMKKGATIAQLSSIMGSIAENATGSYYDYRMSKTALNMFNKCLALEYPEMSCIVLHPGWVKTEMGGKGANLEVSDCCKGLYKVITSATPAESGNFYDYKAKEIPW